MARKQFEVVSAQTRPQFEAKLRELLVSGNAKVATPWDAPTGFVSEHDLIVYIGGQPGASDVPEEVIVSCIETIDERGYVESARPCGAESVLVAVARCCVEGSIGCFVLDDEVPSLETTFASANGGAIISVQAEHIDDVADMLDDVDVPYTALGQVGGDRIIASGEPDNVTYIDLALSDL